MNPRIKARLPAILIYAAIWTAFHYIYYKTVHPGMEIMPIVLIFGMFVLLNGTYIGFHKGWRRLQYVLRAIWSLLMIPAFLYRTLGMNLLGAAIFQIAVLIALIAIGIEIYSRIQDSPSSETSPPPKPRQRAKKKSRR